jgi:hypothetical protein
MKTRGQLVDMLIDISLEYQDLVREEGKQKSSMSK